MDIQEKILRCFVIGPMTDMTRLYKLAYEIVEPLVKPSGYEVITPDQGEIGSIMNQVLLNLEQADILIADVTGNNPNVMYELGIYHSYGKPYIVIKDRSQQEHEVEKTPFDIASFRYIDIDLRDIERSQNAIRPVLEKTLQKMDEVDWFENPVTIFYNSPVAEIPTAVGLFKNYSKNFLQQIIPDLFRKDESGKEYIMEVSIYEPDNPEANNEGFIKLQPAQRRLMQLEVMVPEMYMVNHEFIRGLKDSDKPFAYLPAKIQKRTRPFNLHYRRGDNGEIVLADFPSVLDTLNESIIVRRKKHERKIEDKEWRLLEQQELERFYKKCNQFLVNTVSQYPQVMNKVQFAWGWNPLK